MSVLQDPDPDVDVALCLTDLRSARLPLLTLTTGGNVIHHQEELDFVEIFPVSS